MEPTAGQVLDEVLRLQSLVIEARGEAPNRHDLEDSFSAAIKRVMSDREAISGLLDLVVNVAQDKAARTTGRALGGFVRTVIVRWFVVAALMFWVAKNVSLDAAGKLWAMVRAL